MPTFFFRTLGSPALLRDGVPLDAMAPQRKALALLAVIAASGDAGIARDRVMALLWPESDEERARGALKQMLHVLRRHLGTTEAIRGTAELRLDGALVQSDVALFRAACASGDLEEAVRLYTGPFLDGVYLDAAPEFERWLDTERAALARRYEEALERLARAAAGEGRHEQAVRWWRMLQEADRLSARAAVGLMEALDAAGNRAAALQHARTHELLLREEWGIEPDPAVTSLAARLRLAPDRPPEAVADLEPSPSAVVADEGDGAAYAAVEPPTEAGERAAAASPDLRFLRPVLMAAAAILVLSGALAAGAALQGVTRTGPGGDAGTQHVLAENEPARAREPGSIAVLPMLDLSPEGDQEHLSDGITEELITHLSRVEGLRVAARTSSFQFKGTRTDVREVGRRLGVVHVLEGSVRKANDRLRITVQLSNVEDGFHVWAETYERQVSDVFAVQEEISHAIADALRLHIARAEGGTGAPRPTPSVEAYELFLKGRFFASKRTEDGLARAAGYFQQAIAIDPRFARAYVGLADTYLAPRSGAPAERFLRARELVTTALALDSTLAEAHASRAWIQMWYDRDWAAAERHLQRAMALDPGYLWAQMWYSGYLGAVGRLDEALTVSRRAQQLDPLSVAATTHLGTHLFWLGRHEEAIHQYRKALELDANFFMARWGLSRAYLALGRHEEAMRELQYPGTDYVGFFRPALVGYAHAVAGQEAEARRVLEELRERRDRGEYVAPTQFAAIHLGLGERNQAMDWLERHEADRGARIFLKVDPIFAPLHTEPRFQRLLQRLALE